MAIEDKIKEFSLCLWKSVANSDEGKERLKCLNQYTTLSKDKPCFKCDGMNIYCGTYIAKGKYEK